MDTDSESDDMKLNIGEQLTKKYFWFLVDKYGMKYEKYTFRSKKMLIEVQVGHKTPRVVFNKVGEPDPQLFYLELDWVIAFLHGTFPNANHDYLMYSLEENIIFVSKMFRENSDKLIKEFDSWWIPVHVFIYKWMERKAREEGRLEGFYKTDKYYSDYLKSKGAL